MTYFNFKTFSTVPCSLIYETAISANTAHGHFLSRDMLDTGEDWGCLHRTRYCFLTARRAQLNGTGRRGCFESFFWEGFL